MIPLVDDQRMFAQFLKRLRRGSPPLALLSVHDASMARFATRVGVDALLVEESISRTVLGKPRQSCMSMSEMLHHCRAVWAGAKDDSVVIVDMPFTSYATPSEAVSNARRLCRFGATAVKLTGCFPAQAKAISDAGVPVCTHLGISNDFHVQPGCIPQWTDYQLHAQAERMANAGCFAIVLEGVPPDVASDITKAAYAPTIGIGSGLATNAQTRVVHDILRCGLPTYPHHTKAFANVGTIIEEGIAAYVASVRPR